MRESQKKFLSRVLFTLSVTAVAPTAMAYVGPGAGLGIIGAILAVIVGIAATILGLVLLPIRMIRQRRKAAAAKASESSGPTGQ